MSLNYRQATSTMKSLDYCLPATSAVTQNYIVNCLTRPNAQKQEGVQVLLPHIHAQSPRRLFWVVSSQSETSRSIQKDVDATMHACDQFRLSQCPASPICQTVICRCKSVFGRKHSAKLDVVFCSVHTSSDDRQDNFDEPMWPSEENSKTPPLLVVNQHRPEPPVPLRMKPQSAQDSTSVIGFTIFSIRVRRYRFPSSTFMIIERFGDDTVPPSSHASGSRYAVYFHMGHHNKTIS